MTFREVAKMEPRLAELESDILTLSEQSKRQRRFCANEVWYGEFKERMKVLVGWGGEVEQLQNCEAYDTAYFHLWDLLPPCRHMRRGCGSGRRRINAEAD